MSDVKKLILSSCNKDYLCLSYNLSVCKNMERVDWRHNMFSKIIFYSTRLKELPPNTFVVLIDAADVLCINPDMNDMYSKFTKMEKDIVFGAENGGRFVFEKSEEGKLLQYMNIFNQKHPEFITKHERRWLSESTILNSGLICGYSDKISEFFDLVVCEHPNHYDDQSCMINTILNHPHLADNITVDYDSTLFHNFTVFHEENEDYQISQNKCLMFKEKSGLSNTNKILVHPIILIKMLLNLHYVIPN